MKWIINKPKEPKDNQWRTIKKFAFFPITISIDEDQDETRWLETVYIDQIYDVNYWVGGCWLNMKFSNRNNYEKGLREGFVRV